jgi:PPIC-type PPIASE domain
MNRQYTVWILTTLLLAGCEIMPPGSDQPGPTDTPQAVSHPQAASPVAYINGKAITDRDLKAPLVEAAGGTVLSELVLDRMIRERLERVSLTLTPEMIEREKSHMLATLSADPDDAVRLLEAMRTRRGLGDQRFESMLYRNAGLRLLVQDEVQIVPQLLRRAYELRYGERYRVRIIVAESMAQTSSLLVRARSGESFSDLASLNSTDPSAAQGGLLSPISPIDMTYPKALRQTLLKLEVGQVSDLIAADDRFIIMKLEETLIADPISFEQVRPELERTVRLEAEGQLMQQAARSMLTEAKVVVLDPALGKSWRAQQERTRSE